MEWVLFASLAWVTSASAGHYGDYTGVKMPQYGSNDYEAAQDVENAVEVVADYHGHSLDAPASLDYKFENGKSEKPDIESDDPAIWNKLVRNPNKLLRPPGESILETGNKYESDTKGGLRNKPNKRLHKHRSRFEDGINLRTDEESTRGLIKRARTKMFSKDVDNNDDFYRDDNELSVQKRDDLVEVSERVRYRETSETAVRRKQRDRFLKRMQPESGVTVDDVGFDRKNSGNKRLNMDYIPEKEGRSGRRRLHRPQVDDENEEDSESTKQKPPSVMKKMNEDYGDYYDMKRVHNINIKLPTLIKRTTAKKKTTAVTTEDVFGAVWHYRRQRQPATPTKTTTEKVTSATEAVLSEATTSLATTPTRTTSTTTPTTTTVNATSTQESVTTVTLSTATQSTTTQSLVEKSRLSNLQKAQWKEGMHRLQESTRHLNDFTFVISTRKPLWMQVTNPMLTFAVAEPTTTAVPWERASLVANDVPERLERAKKLMRHMLVARAKNIQELTDNWDEVICEYIDVRLLDHAPRVHPSHVFIMQMSFLLIFYWTNDF